MKEKIAIVLSGGGMAASSYLSGALLALIKKYDLKHPDIALGGSGSGAVLAYYVSQQYDYIRKFITTIDFEKVINTRRFWKPLNLDYLIEIVLKKQFPLNIKNIKNSRTKLLIGAINQKTGEVRYFSNKDDIFLAIRATKSVPIVCKSTKIGTEYYHDSYASCSSELNTLKAIELGAKKIIRIEKGHSEKTWKGVFKLWFLTKNRRFKKNYNGYMEKEKGFEIPKDVRVVRIRPTIHLGISNLSTKKELLKKSMKQGYNDITNSKELEELLYTKKTHIKK